MNVKLVTITPDAEKLVAYCARVSSTNQDNPEIAGLLKYCIKHGHWSIFEQASMTIEIETSRAISAQILRHRSFKFQEFSQRYAKANNFEMYEPRSQDTKNRQNSIDDLDQATKDWFFETQLKVTAEAEGLYNKALSLGIAKECARFLLPLSTTTKLYMTGDVRSWIHYINSRTDVSTQLEHRQIAEEIKKVFKEQFPVISEALGW